MMSVLVVFVFDTTVATDVEFNKNLFGSKKQNFYAHVLLYLKNKHLIHSIALKEK